MLRFRYGIEFVGLEVECNKDTRFIVLMELIDWIRCKVQIWLVMEWRWLL